MLDRNNTFYSKFFLVIAFIFLAGMSAQLQAQEIQQPLQPDQKSIVEKINTKQRAELKEDAKQISAWVVTIEQYEKALQRKGISSVEIDNIIKDATNIQTKALLLEQELRPKLNAINDNLTALGNAPKEGEPKESSELQTLRNDLVLQQKIIANELKFIQLAQSKSNQLISAFNDSRRLKLLEITSKRGHTVFSPQLWSEFFLYLNKYINSITQFFTDTFFRIISSDDMSLGDWSIFVLFQGLLAVLAVATFFIVRFLRNILLRRRINSRAKISIEALFSIFKQAILPLYFIAALTAILELSSFANTTIANVSTAIYKSFSYGILLYVLARIFLSPRDETKRIFRVTTPTAKRIFTFLNFAAINVFIHQFINNSNLVSAFPEGLNDGFNIIYAAITIFISASVLYIVTKNHRENEISIESHQTLINWRIGRPVLWVLTLLILAAILTGYINLAEFSTTLIYNLVITSAFFWLFLEIIDNALSQLFHQNSSFTRDLSNFFGLKHNRIRQAGVILVGFMRILIVLLFVAILAENFGFYSSDWFIWIKRAFFGFSIGNIVISPATILTVIVIAILGFAATKAIQNWLGNQYLPTTELDHGVRNSISTVFGYTGTIIVCLFAATYAGLNFQNLAIIFGALSVGIGFGLQSIVGNFVSGLILLAERPIKVGDWIITSGGEGTVRNISVRSTQIETFDRSTIIVPNQTLITEPVSNWTFRNELGRIKVAVGTDYNSDPEQVRDILIECAKEHKGILNYPEPHVLFLNMGADALEFELRAYLKDIGNGAFVKSDLRFAILKALREADINIPFPQRHVHIEGLEKLINAKDDKEE